YAYWRKTRFDWYVGLGLQSDNLRLRDHDPDELAFYSTATADIEYSFPFGVSELEGIAHRGDYDLSQHMKFSGKDLTYFDEESKSRFTPHVIEPSAGADRATLAFLCEAFQEDVVENETRTVLKFHPRLAPIKTAVFPLVKRDGMPEKAEAVHRQLREKFASFYDEKGAIGRRYRRRCSGQQSLRIIELLDARPSVASDALCQWLLFDQRHAERLRAYRADGHP
ncbi:MAG: Glycine--tRNA ligase, partial [Pseudomonadota bacterium]